jgi:sodium-dependent dicarboxylate transporter 2/3/5
VLGIFLLTGLGWIFRDVWAEALGVEHLVHAATVAVAAALVLFILPAGRSEPNQGRRLLDWQQAQTVPWGVAMIVGSGYAIAKGFAVTGLATWLGGAMAPIGALPVPVIVLLVVLFMTFITEINSNTATASIFLPVLATMAAAGNTHPFLLMILATCLLRLHAAFRHRTQCGDFRQWSGDHSADVASRLAHESYFCRDAVRDDGALRHPPTQYLRHCS